MGVAAAQHEANIAAGGSSYAQPMQLMVVVEVNGVGAGAGTYTSTNLLLRDIIELYPDLLLGRRGVIMRNDDGGRAETGCEVVDAV